MRRTPLITTPRRQLRSEHVYSLGTVHTEVFREVQFSSVLFTLCALNEVFTSQRSCAVAVRCTFCFASIWFALNSRTCPDRMHYASWLFAPWCRIIVCFLVIAVTALFSDWRPRFTHVCCILFTYTLFTRATLFYSAGTSYGPVSVSVTIRSFIEAAERIGLGFGIGASFDLSYTVFKEIRVPLK